MPPHPFEDAALRSVFDDNPHAMVVLDREGRVRMWNRAAERLTGWAACDVLGSVPPYIPPEQMDGFVHRHAAAFEASGDLPDITVRRQHRDGHEMQLIIARSVLREAKGAPMAVLGVLTDVTQRLADEEEQRRAEANLRSLIEKAPIAMIVHRDGCTLYANPQCGDLFGYDPEELIGRPILDLVHPDERASVRQRVSDVKRGRVAPPRNERFLKKDGTIFHAEVTGVPILFGGKPAVLAVARDLTESIQMEAELRARDRLASVGRLAASVGHEINNPLAYVLGNLEILSRRLEAAGATELHELARQARDGAERVRLIVRDLRVFSQRDTEALVPVDLRRVLESCIAMGQHELRHRARITRRFDDVPPVLGSEARLGQVFLNLLVNAAHAIPEGKYDDNEISIEARREGEKVVVEVRDTGVGIPEEVRDHVFEPFVSTKGQGEGTGLGLWICKSIVTRLGGTIRIASAPTRGTAVTVELPIAGPLLHAVPSSASPEPRPSARYRVLAVDDEHRVAAAIAALLDEHDVAVESRPEVALERLGAGEQFDAIVCDLMMPSMSGMELFERARAMDPALAPKFVFMTGGALSARAAAFLREQTNPCLEKPFDSAKIEEAIRIAARSEARSKSDRGK